MNSAICRIVNSVLILYLKFAEYIVFLIFVSDIQSLSLFYDQQYLDSGFKYGKLFCRQIVDVDEKLNELNISFEIFRLKQFKLTNTIHFNQEG
jgi:hypothetical protein